MKIGMVFHAAYPWNRGVDQLAQSLRALSHSPEIIARRPSGQTAKQDKVNDVPVFYVPPQRNNRFANLQAFHFGVNPFWRNWLISIGRKHQWHAIFLRDTQLSWSTVAAARKLNIPVFLDIRENNAAIYRQSKDNPNLARKILRNPFFVRVYERWMIPKFDHVFTVSEELRQWVLDDHVIRQDKVSVLQNLPTETFVANAAHALKKKSKRLNEHLVLVFAGNIVENRGLIKIISAMPLVLEKQPCVSLRIIGDGREVPNLRQQVTSLKLEDKVEFIPLLPPDELPKALVSCDIGICSYYINELTNQTMPGKLFEYMAAGLPILSSSRKPVMRILNEVNCGVVFNSFEPSEIASKMLELIVNEEKRNHYGHNAFHAVQKKYNWRLNLETLQQVISSYCKKTDGC
jgi:glycosyltransferase involved in cell wall biosynthesis